MTVVRAPEHLVFGVDGPCVVLTGRVALMLCTAGGLDQARVTLRGQDPELDHALVAIALAGRAWSADTGRSVAPQPAPVQRSGETIGTSRAADILGLSPRTVRQAIADGHLRSTRDDGGRHRIDSDELGRYLAERRSR